MITKGKPEVREPWTKITVVLLDRHVAFLDGLCIDIRLKHGRALSRAEVIRAIIEAARKSGIDLTQASSLDGIVELMAAGPRKKGARSS